MEKYKTIQQLEAEMNIGKFYCKCLNSGVNSFTGMCSRCGMSKGSGKLLEQKGEPFQINEIYAKKIKTEMRNESLEKLISSTPNDQELGEKVRKMFR